MRRTAYLSAALFLLALPLALPMVLPAPALAVESILAPTGMAPEQLSQVPSQPQQAPSTLPVAEASSSLPLQANAPVYMDQALAHEHERFTQFAIEQMRRMNANIIGGRNSMQVQKQGDGLYRASYKAIDVEGIVCQVRRSPSNPNYFVGSVLYKEQILESVAEASEACRKGNFQPVSEKANRIIYSSKHGGGWQ